MYASYQIDWGNRGYFTPSLHGAEMPTNTQLHPAWRLLQRHLKSLAAGEFGELNELISLARGSSSGMMRECFLYLLTDAGTPSALRALADDALDSVHPEYPAQVAQALAQTGMLQFMPDVLELYARRHDGGTFATALPLMVSQVLEPAWGPLSDWDEHDDDGELYCAKVEAFLPGFIDRIGSPSATALYGQLFGVRYLAESFIDLLGDWDRRGEWPRLRQSFEGSTGIDLSPGYQDRHANPLKIRAILEDFLESPEAERYEHGVRYFWGHRIPD
ncbi:hypothetical protein PPSIR1_22239 [Plesiocystis pacifica SIR-1]|uniref:Uncharacterized protein n=1 Tax=Plesiocystis pacifica SIR-1 TaxID=391625 RepID=A6FXU5_9BACT|nr:hypothetical protein [Plesiocystis pacifica]EDM81683.1 hypothetical protein PPSIR1_22239 [Plesiocystis pacifica SIR-1]